MLNVMIFLLLITICIGLIYIVHKYFGKHELYLLVVIYSIISFVLSFKLFTIFGLNINLGTIFSNSLLILMYYFVNRFSASEVKKYILVVMISIIFCLMFLLLGTVMVPSIYDDNLILIKDLIYDNLAIAILHPLSLFITLLLSCYTFKELKKVNKNRELKTMLTITGIMFVDIFIFIYFSYAIIIEFNKSLLISIDNYFTNVIIMIILYLLINKIMKVKKVKE